jgi:SAM-dependent methyltransferase
MSNAGIGTVFDSTAVQYAEISPLLWDRIGQATVEAARIQPGEHVLDVCCGAGASAIPAAKAAGPQGRVDAIDLAGELLAQGRRRAAREGLVNVRFLQADAETWEPDAHRLYDLVQCVLGVFFLSDMEASVSRLARMVRPGGRLLITTWAKGAMGDFGRLFAEAVGHVRSSTPGSPPSRHAAARIDTEKALAAWMSAHGVEGATVIRSPLRIPLDAPLAWRLAVGSGFRGMLTGLEKSAVEQVRETFQHLLDKHELNDLDATTLVGVGVVKPRGVRE